MLKKPLKLQRAARARHSKGEHVAIWASNIPEWILLQFATARIGAVLVTVNTSYQARELEYLLEHSDSTTLFLMDGYKGTSYIDMVDEIMKNPEKLPKLKNLVYLGKNKVPEHMTAFADIAKLGETVSDADLFEREQSLTHDDVINMQYTSGTTGFPKGVMLTHYNIVNNAAIVADRMGLTSEDRLCIPVPLFHCFGCVLSTLACVASGAAMLPIIEFKPDIVLQTVEKERCTGLQGVPTMFIAELTHPDFANYDLSSLRTGIMAGSPCPRSHEKSDEANEYDGYHNRIRTDGVFTRDYADNRHRHDRTPRRDRRKSASACRNENRRS